MCIFKRKTKDYNYFDTTEPIVYADGDAIFCVGEDNNGVEKYGAEPDRLTAVTPSKRQLGFLELEYYNFLHFGMNTFSGREWGDGSESPARFNPIALDTDKWCEALRASGAKGVILTAKHHDGFALWQTETTEHSVKNSPFREGNGDVVKELSESCKKFGLKFGLYLSPWDRNAKCYGHNAYNDFYIRQLTELCTKYGKLFCMWFDGARGEDAVLDADFEYDWKRITETVRKYQPDCVMAVSGPDVRWVGNEAGAARASEWCLNGGKLDPNKVAELSQKNPEMADKLQKISFDSEDIGSRAVLAAYEDIEFYPAEADVSIRRGWFYHRRQAPKTVEQLLKIYYKTAGANCSMLLNIPPDKKGEIDKKDVAVLKAFGDKIAQDRSKPIAYTAAVGNLGDGLRTVEGLAAIETENTKSFVFGDKDTVLDLQFAEKKKVLMISIREDLSYSERIEKYDIYAKADGGWQLLSNSTNVGNRRSTVIAPENRVLTDTVRIVIRQSRKNPVLRSVSVYGE